MRMKAIMEKNGWEVSYYETDTGCIVKREYGKTPNGNYFKGAWVYRDVAKNLIDFDKYRNDLFERCNLVLITENSYSPFEDSMEEHESFA